MPDKAAVMQMLKDSGVTPDILKEMIWTDPNDRKITSEDIRRHKGNWISVPEDVTYGEVLSTIERLKQDEEQVTRFEQAFPFRPNDCLVAAAHVMTDLWGMTLGQDGGFFGPPPSLTTVQVSLSESVQVPSGAVTVPMLGNASFHLGATLHPDFGAIGRIAVQAPKMYRKKIETFFQAVARRLVTNSIYRGKAVLGADAMEFQDVQSFNAESIVLADDVSEVFEKAVWGAIRYADALRQNGIPIKRAVLLHGEYGTGKTSGALITAQIAEQHGWTCITAKPGDSLTAIFQTASLYAPAVVVFEDLDKAANSGDPQQVSELLDLLDGAAAKNREVIALMTTNKAGEIHKGMFRPGRIDFAIKIGKLDRHGVEKLIRRTVGENLDSSIDWNNVYGAAEEFGPAFVRAVCDRAKGWAVVNARGEDGYKIGTEELVRAAESLLPQLALQDEASEGVVPPDLDTAFGTIASKAAQAVLEKAKITNDNVGTSDVSFPEPQRA